MKKILLAFVLGACIARAAPLPADRETVPSAELAAIAAADEYPATSGFTQRVEYIDFGSFGQDFTQVVVILTPDKPRLHSGRKLVVVIFTRGLGEEKTLLPSIGRRLLAELDRS